MLTHISDSNVCLWTHWSEGSFAASSSWQRSEHEVLQAVDVAQERHERCFAPFKIESPGATRLLDHDSHRFLGGNRCEASSGLLGVELRRFDWDQLNATNRDRVTGAESLHRLIAEPPRPHGWLSASAASRESQSPLPAARSA